MAEDDPFDRFEIKCDPRIRFSALLMFILQFGSNSGERLKISYGEFCRKHKEAVACYKEQLKTDRNFQNFVKVGCCGKLASAL